MARPYWSGQIRISLVSFGVKLFVATESRSDIHFHEIDRRTGERVRHQKVLASTLDRNPDDTAEPSEVVQRPQIVKGYEYEKGHYVTIEPDELAHLRVPSKSTMEVTEFVDAGSIPPEYFEKPYYVTPENEASTESFLTVRQALLETKKIALSKIAFGGREHVVAIAPAGSDAHPGMTAFTLRYAAELRQPETYFHDIKKATVSADSLGLARELIQRKTGAFDPAKFSDGYETAVKELVEAKLQHLPLPQEDAPAAPRAKVINLMDALRRSVQDDAQPAATTPTTAAKPAPHRGLKLVKGKAETSSKPSPKPATKSAPRRPAKATASRRRTA